jgi:hypothetical protein
MNNEDLAVLEHNRVVQHAYDQAYGVVEHDAQLQATEQAELAENAVLGGMVVALKMRSQNQAFANLQRKFSEQNAVISAMHTAVDSLTTSLAKQRNSARDELAGRVSGLMTEVFDSRIEEYMEQGSLDTDPRIDPNFREDKEWYQP